MELRGLATMACVLALAPDATAQTAATDERPSARREVPKVGIGAHVGGGVAYASGVPDAWMARLEYEAFPFLAPRGTVGGLFGFLGGIEYWRGGADNWGMTTPFAIVGGMRAVAVRGYVGFGLDMAGIDQVADDTGFVYCAPLALASLGLDVRGITVMADARVSRRWQIGADDHTQWMFGLMVGSTLEPVRDQRYFY